MNTQENTDYTSVVQSIKQELDAMIEEAMTSVKNQLGLKYGCDFFVDAVSPSADFAATAFYLHPDFDENLVFKAVLGTKPAYFTDNLISRMAGAEVSCKLTDLLSKSGICAQASTLFIRDSDCDEDDVSIRLTEYCEKYNVKNIFIYMAIDKAFVFDNAANQLLAALKSLSEAVKAPVAVTGYVLDEYYADAASNMPRVPDISNTWFDQYEPTAHFSAVWEDGKCNVTAAELQKILSGEQ